jgi:hypothetical protein
MSAIRSILQMDYANVGLLPGSTGDASGESNASGNLDFAGGGVVPSRGGNGGRWPPNKAAPNPEDARTQRLAGTSGGGPKTARGASEQQPPTFTDPNAVATSVRTVVPGYRDRANKGGFKKRGQSPGSPRGYAAGGVVKGYDDGGVVDDDPEDTNTPIPQDPNTVVPPSPQAAAPSGGEGDTAAPPSSGVAGSIQRWLDTVKSGTLGVQPPEKVSPEERMRRIQGMVMGEGAAPYPMVDQGEKNWLQQGATPFEATVNNVAQHVDDPELAVATQREYRRQANIGAHTASVAINYGHTPEAVDLLNQWAPKVLGGVDDTENLQFSENANGSYHVINAAGDQLDLTPEQMHGVLQSSVFDTVQKNHGLWPTLQEASKGKGLPLQGPKPEEPPGGPQPKYPEYTPPTNVELARRAMTGPINQFGDRLRALQNQRDQNIINLQKQGIASQSRVNVAGINADTQKYKSDRNFDTQTQKQQIRSAADIARTQYASDNKLRGIIIQQNAALQMATDKLWAAAQRTNQQQAALVAIQKIKSQIAAGLEVDPQTNATASRIMSQAGDPRAANDFVNGMAASYRANGAALSRLQELAPQMFQPQGDQPGSVTGNPGGMGSIGQSPGGRPQVTSGQEGTLEISPQQAGSMRNGNIMPLGNGQFLTMENNRTRLMTPDEIKAYQAAKRGQQAQ